MPLADKFPVDCDPLKAFVPAQAPEAEQALAFDDDHVSVALLPLVTVLGVAAKVTVGTAAVTETKADCVALPPVPVHVSLYVVFTASEPVSCEPLSASLPAQPPEAVQVVALLVLQVSTAEFPAVTELGVA